MLSLPRLQDVRDTFVEAELETKQPKKPKRAESKKSAAPTWLGA
jgi:hypothetical protein